MAEREKKEDRHWGDAVAGRVIERFPNREVYACAAGISPSGIVHFGNFRDVMTVFAVMRGLAARGKKTRFVFSWDDFDRFRKVPANIPESFREHIGKPLAEIPDPQGEHESYSARFESEFERAARALGIELEYRYQSREYRSGRYDERIIHALRKREEIAEILLSFMSEKGKKEKEIDEEKFRETRYPISIYSRFTGKDSTRILGYDGGSRVTYECLESGESETVDLRETRIAKLSWKVDWAMRWAEEGVVFEPGGHDHASPGGSYDVSSVIARKIFGVEPPVFVGYGFVGLRGLGSKMSGSKGNAVSPEQLLGIYEPALLKWLYLRRAYDQTFSLAFDSEVFRQYDEFDRERALCAGGKLAPVNARALEMSSYPENPPSVGAPPIPFRQIVSLGQITQWNREKLNDLFREAGASYDALSVETRISRAKNWLETYNAGEMIRLLDVPDSAYAANMGEGNKAHVRRLRDFLRSGAHSIAEIEAAMYDIPKDDALSDKENRSRQKAFFADIYNLLIGADAGPRLSTFLWVLDRSRVLALLDI
ncbi:MAG: lysine--tRNA ligase [Candidatus Colwellbacteria bacterium]|nr:lysine--tRNA ligase [Candidatus Colwellbacteria bacterium]